MPWPWTTQHYNIYQRQDTFHHAQRTNQDQDFLLGF
jgi:hypothetical protein